MYLGDVIEQDNLAARVAWIVFNFHFQPSAAAIVEVEMDRQFAALLLRLSLQFAQCVTIFIIQQEYLIPGLTVGAGAAAAE